MRAVCRQLVAIGMLCLLIGQARAAALLDQVQLVADATVAANPTLPAQTFTVQQAGSYVITLTDLQLPTALASLQLTIATSTASIVKLTTTSATTTTPQTSATQTVQLQPGTYYAQALASAAAGSVGGTFGVQVAPAGGGAAILQFSDAVGPVNPSPTTGQSVISAKFTVSTGGTYQLSATDLAFPVALSSFQITILNDCGTTSGCVSHVVSPTPMAVTGTSSTPVTLPAGTYDVFIAATAGTNPSGSGAPEGLYSVRIAGGPDGSVYNTTNPVGELPTPISIPIATAGTLSLQVTDLSTPAALTSINAVALQDSTALGQPFTAAGSQLLAISAGTLQVYVAALPGGSTNQGSYEVQATMGSQILADVAAPALLTGSYGYAYPVTLSAAGNFQASVNDFQLPVAFSSLNLAVVQAGTVLANSVTTSNSGEIAAAAGPLTILVFPTLAAPTGSSTASDGLYGVRLTTFGSGGSTVFETTQGVGALFSSQTFTVSTAGSYDVQLTDLGFPAKFTQLGVIATRGVSLAGQVVGGGVATIDNATPGTYVLNVLTQVGSGVDYGMYGVQVTPSASVTLMTTASSVTSGGQTTLTWSSTNATGCTASASPSATGWSGALAESGSQSTGALTTATTFTITCEGQSGATATATAMVNVAAPASSHHSGGGISLTELGWLASAAALQLVRRRRASSAGSAGR